VIPPSRWNEEIGVFLLKLFKILFHEKAQKPHLDKRFFYLNFLQNTQTLCQISNFFFKGRKKDFGKVMGVFLTIIGPLAEAI
jgi:hypothetical protein